EFEVGRRNDFSEWREDVGQLVAASRLRWQSAQQLLHNIRGQINDRAEFDEDLARRLSLKASKREAEDILHAKRAAQWIQEDKSDAAFLVDLQRYCAARVVEGARAFKTALESSAVFLRMQEIGQERLAALPALERALRQVDAAEAECTAAWVQHEAACRRFLAPSGGEERPGGDPGLWASEFAYRRALAALDAEAVRCHELAAKAREALGAADSEHRDLSQQFLRDIAACVATTYANLAQVLTPPAGTCLLPQLAGGTAPRGPTPPAQKPGLQAWRMSQPPASSLALREGPVERPPRPGCGGRAASPLLCSL
ncbi:unnamed protein product, partial [Prorocentrum cordatum]